MLIIVFAAAAAATGNVLTLEDALRNAADHQPQIMQARANTSVYQARAGEARAALLPQLNGAASYSRHTLNSAPGQFVGIGTAMQPAVVDTFDSTNAWSFSLGLTQQLYDFGQTIEKFRSAKVTAEAQAAGELNISTQVALSVRTTFFNARATKALVQVARDNLTNQDRHLQQIEGFVKVGTHPEIDLATQKTAVANARVQLITAENNYLTAKAQLNQAMGIEQPTSYDVADETLAPVDVENQGIEDLASEAKKNRPDVIALEKQVAAQRLSIKSAYGGYGPTLNASMGLTDAGTDITNLGWNITAGVSLNWSLFSGLLTWETVKEQKGLLTVAEAQLEQQKQQVRLDVEQARLAVRAAKESIIAADEALVNAKEQLRLAEGRYAAGVGNVIELGDAQVALTTAQGQKVSAEYNLATSRAQLVKALGRR